MERKLVLTGNDFDDVETASKSTGIASGTPVIDVRLVGRGFSGAVESGHAAVFA